MKRLFKRETHSLQEEPVLKPAIVFQVMVVSDGSVQTQHAGREMLPSKQVTVPKVDLSFDCLVITLVLEINEIFLGNVLKQFFHS